MGGGIFAKDHEDPAPTVGIAGRSLGGLLHRPSFTPHAGGPLCAYRQPSSPCGRRAIINGNGVEADHDAARRIAIKTIGLHRWEVRRPDNDAARRVATSFEERENRF